MSYANALDSILTDKVLYFRWSKLLKCELPCVLTEVKGCVPSDNLNIIGFLHPATQWHSGRFYLKIRVYSCVHLLGSDGQKWNSLRAVLILGEILNTWK